ncbi:MAG: YIP1 family protein [Shimia sp.]|nr:YIP1 family protein [Shimia sp.]
MKAQLIELFWMTIRDPSRAASILRQIHMDRQVSWMILLLAITLNTLTYFASIALLGVPAELAFPLLTKPYLVFLMLGITTVIFVFAFYWVGRALEGKATFDTILLMVGWLQYMRLAIQVGSLVLMLVSPGISQIFVMAAGIYGLWVVVNFLKQAHGFETLGKAVAVLIFSALGMTVGLSVLLSLCATTVIGMT